MKTILLSALFLSTTLSAMADTLEDKPASTLHDASRGTILAITERGPHAVDAAHLLAIQTILHPEYKPEFMALENTELSQAVDKYHLTTADLPAFIFVNKQGAEIGRIAAGSLTTVGRYVANNSAIVDY